MIKSIHKSQATRKNGIGAALLLKRKTYLVQIDVYNCLKGFLYY